MARRFVQISGSDISLATSLYPSSSTVKLLAGIQNVCLTVPDLKSRVAIWRAMAVFLHMVSTLDKQMSIDIVIAQFQFGCTVQHVWF